MVLRDNDAEMHDNGAAQFEDAIVMLKAEHQKVRELFQQYTAAGDQRMKQQIAQQVFVELETHAQLEEIVFYPTLPSHPEGIAGGCSERSAILPVLSRRGERSSS
jgi:hypothetical protein